MLLRPLVVGLGRSGAGLHIPALARLRRDGSARDLLADALPLAFDERRDRGAAGVAATTVDSLRQAADLTDPGRTVVHLCTPPTRRVESLERVARAGYRKVIMEKPFAIGTADREAIVELCDRYRLDLVVMAQWLASSLTERIAGLLRGGSLGAPRSLSMVQHKPRFTRTLAAADHPTVFDVELPHGIGLVLHLVGPAALDAASCDDMAVDGVTVPRLGRAELRLRHLSGPRSDLVSDLTAPIRARTLNVELEHGTVVGHFPVSGEDSHARLSIVVDGHEHHSVFLDDAFAAFIRLAYGHFTGSGLLADNLAHNLEVTRLLTEAKQRSGPRRESHVG